MTMLPEFEVLRSAAIEQLERHRVFDIDAYGWLNEDEVDPVFTGYAMWTTSPPYDHDFESWQRNTPPRRAPTAVEQRLMELGHDFFGLMKTARHFVGIAFLAQPAVEPLRLESTDFDFNEFAALVALTSAADRLRDYVIVAILAKKTNEEDQFKQAVVTLRASGLDDEADSLKTGSAAVRKAREARNTATHGLATEPARVQRRLIAMDRAAFLDQGWHKSAESATYEDQIEAMRRADDDEKAEVDARVKLLCDCYRGLVKMGDACFRTEYAWRHRAKR
jgi:hypothetical protein